MNEATIKYKTIEYINGVKYMQAEQVTALCYVVCDALNIENTEENFALIREACKLTIKV